MGFVRQDKNLHYEIRDSRDNSYIADMDYWISKKSKKKEYDQGEEIAFPNKLVHRNNSERLCLCDIDLLREVGEGDFIMYVTPGKKSYEPQGRVDFPDERIIDGVDWSGGDGWLNLGE